MNQATANDPDLVRRAKQGDRAAFAAIYDRHYRAVFNYIFYRVGDTPLAEDLTADVFVRLVEKIHTFTPDRPILAWLYTIARNRVIDHHRRNGRATLVSLDDNLDAAEDDPAAAADAHLRHAALTAALSQLTEEQRLVILLKFVEECSNACAAAVLGKTEGAVKSLQHRALAALERILQPESKR
ncbi:MAG: hypothetical protein Kow0080_36890 [Candidatus Promineifilaceae bacterium]